MTKFQTEESAFNFAIEYLKDISTSLKMCKQYSSLGNADGWVAWLRIAYRELSCKTNKKEDEDFDNYFRTINKLMNNREQRIINRTQILYLLDQLEIKIRKTLQAKGMLLPSKEDPRFAVLQR
ncbi:MAG: hypothetical protein WC758_08000 [Candidatus Woesearchaeota archaeon]|jgi:hypothetical protein